MKRKNNITLSTKICAVILLSSMVLSACADTQTAQKQKIPAATYMGGDNTSAEVCKALKDAGASHVDIFQDWVADFADSAGKNAKLEDNWSDPQKLKADTGKCMDGWETKHDYSDADCRMTAFGRDADGEINRKKV